VRFGGTDQQKIYQYILDCGMEKELLDKYIRNFPI
jgi:hypothetical protein